MHDGRTTVKTETTRTCFLFLAHSSLDHDLPSPPTLLEGVSNLTIHKCIGNPRIQGPVEKLYD